MDILNQGFDSDDSTDVISELVGDSAPPSRIPQSAIKNRAALTTMLTSPPDQVIEHYRQTVQDFSEGREDTLTNFIDQNALKQKDAARQHFISILADKSVPLEEKRKVMKLIQENDFIEDPSTTLQIDSLSRDSKGEDSRGEAARLSLSSTMAEMQQDRANRQRMSNAIGASLPNASASTVLEMVESDIMPFGRNIITANMAQRIREETGVPSGLAQWVADFFTPGTTRKEILDKMNRIPIDKRGQYQQALLTAIEESSAIFPDQNSYSKFKQASELLERDFISSSEAWVDNMMTVADIVAVGSIGAELLNTRRVAQGSATSNARSGASVGEDIPWPQGEKVHPAKWELVEDPIYTNPYQLGPQRPRLTGPRDDIYERLEKNATVRPENPATPYSIVEQANPAQARIMFDAIVVGTDEVAEAMTGLNKIDALANGVYPQMAVRSGNVLNKVDQTLKQAANEAGAYRYTQSEFESGVASVTNDFRNTTSIQMNVPMTTFKTDGDHVIVSGHYGTVGGNFTNADEAFKQTKFALRHTGILDEEITIMKRDGMDFVPVDDISKAGSGEFMARVDMRVPITDADITNWSDPKVKWNFFDRLGMLGSERKGSVTGWVFEPGSRFDPVISGSMSVAADKTTWFGNMLLRPIKEFRGMIDKFPVERRAKIDEYVIEANMNQLPFDEFNLYSRGFTKDEIASLKLWRDIWDGHYYLENLDLVRTLRNQSYQVMESGKTKLFAKPIQKNQNITSVYDPTMETIRMLPKEQLDELYNTGGTLAQLRRPITIDGKEVSHIISRNNADEYLRRVRDNDQVLNYREGYFTLKYKAPRFIEEEIIVDGTTQYRVIAVAGSTKDADDFIAASQATNPERVLRHRQDLKNRAIDAGDDNWDINHSGGRIAQRVRGEPLVQAVGENVLGKPSVIVNPMESATIAARSIAGRTMERSAIETAKARFVTQYGDLLPRVNGQISFPNHRDMIQDKASNTSKRVADARDTYQYIRFMEDGYVNTADEVFKGAMNGIADVFGKYHLSSFERGAKRVAESSPTNIAKSTAYQAYIAFDIPFRQWLVQGYQSSRIVALNPVGISNGGIGERMMAYFGKQFGKEGTKEAKSFVDFVEKSGMMDGVDRNSLVRGMSLAMADHTSKTVRNIGAVMALPQKAGFEIGEKLNVLSHLASVHEKYTRKGLNMNDLTNRELAWSETRALLWDLNKAGELAYTNATPAVLMQFMQVPQKAFLQFINRRIPGIERARLFAWDAIMWGVPSSLGVALYQSISDEPVLPDDPQMADFLTDGITGLLYNGAINSLYADDSGRETDIDYSPLSPYGLDGMTRMLEAFNDGGPLHALTISPAGQLLARNGVNGATKDGRITGAMISMARYFNVFDEIDPENPTKFNAVVNDVLKITSGWNRYDQFLMANEHRKKIDARGGMVQSQLTMPEVWATLLGFGTTDQSRLYETQREVRKFTEKQREETARKYRDMVTYLKTQTQSGNFDPEHVQAAISLMMRTFTSPQELEYVNELWKRDMAGPEANMTRQLWRAAGITGSEELIDTIKRSRMDATQKEQLLGIINDTSKASQLAKERKLD